MIEFGSVEIFIESGSKSDLSSYLKYLQVFGFSNCENSYRNWIKYCKEQDQLHKVAANLSMDVESVYELVKLAYAATKATLDYDNYPTSVVKLDNWFDEQIKYINY